jgi:hypothetical protein
LKPTVTLRCAQSEAAASASSVGDVLDITAINGVAIAGHQGAGTITDLTIRTLLTLPAEFVPQQVVSLMRYPGAPNTHAVPTYWSHIHLAFGPAVKSVSLSPAAAAAVARSGRSGPIATAPLVTPTYVSASQWEQLITRIAALPAPTVATKPSSSAIADPKRP